MLQGEPVGVLEGPVLDGLHPREEKQQQDGLPEPLVHDHLIGHGVDLGHPRLALVKEFDRLVDDVESVRVRRRELPTALPQLAHRRAQVVHRFEVIRSSTSGSGPDPEGATGQGILRVSSLLATSSSRSSGCTRATRTWPDPAGP